MLATLWLLDAALQIQPFMFTRGPDGFSGMLTGAAAGNPGWIAHSITWNASIVHRQPILTDTVFAGIQFLIAFGLVYQRTRKPALVLSIAWSIFVWWFGEGLGAILSGGATPFGGGPGGVLFYAVLAVLLWPREDSDRPFVAARAVGVHTARATWWPCGRCWASCASWAPAGRHRPFTIWWRHEQRTAGLVGPHRRLHGVTLPPSWDDDGHPARHRVHRHRRRGAPSPAATRFTIVLAVVVFTLIWVAVQNFGGILAGGATDPNAAPLVILIALIYWPLPTDPAA